MKVVVITGKKKMEQREREVPQPGLGELQVKLEYVGVCGSDLHLYSERHLANWIPGDPLVLEHEPGGVVSTIGEGVTGFETGDRVALGPGVPYGHCENCLKGHCSLCRSVRFVAIPDEKSGVFSEYCTHAASMAFKFPGSASITEGGLMEPLAAGIRTCKLSSAKLGETAIVLGAGYTDLATLMFLKAWGVSRICVVDVLGKRLEKTRELGVTGVFSSRNENIEEFVKALPGDGVDQVYEYVGNHITTPQTCRLIKRAGKITLAGTLPEPVLELNIATLDAMERTIYSIYRYRNLYPSAINAVNKGLIPLKEIVSRALDLEDAIERVDYSLSHKDGIIKAAVRM